MKNVQDTVVNGVAAVQDKRQYARPEIEVVYLDEQPRLLAESVTRSFGAGLSDDDETDW